MPIKPKKIGWVMAVIVGVLVVWFTGGLIKINYFSKNNLIVKPIDNQGVFVGDQLQMVDGEPKKIYQEINYVWDQIRMGNEAKKEERFADASEFYKNAFSGTSGNMKIITPERGLGAKYLIETYEKLERYDEALVILAVLDENFYKGEFGLKESIEIRNRLLAAKAQVAQGKGVRGQILP